MQGPLTQALESILEPVTALFEPTKRVYWPFLAASAVMAVAVWALHVRGRRSLLGYLFPRKVWLHPSALFDVRLMFARAVLGALLLGPFVISKVAVAVGVARALRSLFGATHLSWTSGAATFAFAITAFLAEDFARYVVHRLAHRVPALWELHKVHHSAEVLTPFTLYRTHPIESVIMRGAGALSVGTVAGIFAWAFGGASGWEILGVDAIGFLWSALGSNLRHSHVWISYGRALEHVFISPAQHQIHHSAEARHYDSNFGSALAVWDWAFGSLYVTRGRERFTVGLPVEEQNHRLTVLSAWFGPLLAIGRATWRRLGALRARRSPAP